MWQQLSPSPTHIPFGDTSPRAERGDFSTQRQTIGTNGANIIYSFIFRTAHPTPPKIHWAF